MDIKRRIELLKAASARLAAAFAAATEEGNFVDAASMTTEAIDLRAWLEELEAEETKA